MRSLYLVLIALCGSVLAEAQPATQQSRIRAEHVPAVEAATDLSDQLKAFQVLSLDAAAVERQLREGYLQLDLPEHAAVDLAARGEIAQVARDARPQIRLRGGRRGALVLADLRQHVAREDDVDAGG